MDKTKKNGILKTAACIFGGTMLMTCVLGGTLAQYVSKGTATQTNAEVAKWDIQVDSNKLESELTLNLENMTITSTGAQANAGPYTTKPAPGSYGYKEIEVFNNSEVDANVAISSESATNTNTKIKVAVVADDGGDGLSQEEIVAAASSLDGQSTLVKAGEKKKLYVAYDWVFEGEDELDTALGTTEGGGKINFGSITVEAKQAKYTA